MITEVNSHHTIRDGRHYWYGSEYVLEDADAAVRILQRARTLIRKGYAGGAFDGDAFRRESYDDVPVYPDDPTATHWTLTGAIDAAARLIYPADPHRGGPTRRPGWGLAYEVARGQLRGEYGEHVPKADAADMLLYVTHEVRPQWSERMVLGLLGDAIRAAKELRAEMSVVWYGRWPGGEPTSREELLERLARVAPLARGGDDRDAATERDGLVQRARWARATYGELVDATGLSRQRLHEIVSREDRR